MLKIKQIQMNKFHTNNKKKQNKLSTGKLNSKENRKWRQVHFFRNKIHVSAEK